MTYRSTPSVQKTPTSGLLCCSGFSGFHTSQLIQVCFIYTPVQFKARLVAKIFLRKSLHRRLAFPTSNKHFLDASNGLSARTSCQLSLVSNQCRKFLRIIHCTCFSEWPIVVNEGESISSCWHPQFLSRFIVYNWNSSDFLISLLIVDRLGEFSRLEMLRSSRLQRDVLQYN